MGLRIGKKEYKYKKDALSYYKEILNSYDFDDSLSDIHYDDLLALLDYSFLNYVAEQDDDNNLEQQFSIEFELNETAPTNEDDFSIIDIKIGRVQFNTKCFEVVYQSGESGFISYIMMMKNKSYSIDLLYQKACRNAVQNDLISVKQRFFDENSIKGQVKCQETNKLSFWEELVVDHRQPNTLSIIADRFRELKGLQLSDIEYFSDKKNQLMFVDIDLQKDFSKYHKEKANLRIVRKECNSSRATMARIKQNLKDLKVN